MNVSELRRDPVTGRWVVVSTERPRADDFDRAPVVINPDDQCPFCGGHEHMTPFEVLAYRNGSPSNQPGWDLRVVPNQSPIVRVEGDLDRQGEGLFDKMNGIGAHEVIIESPRHEDTLATQDEAGAERLLRAFLERIQDLRRDIRFKSFLPFKNYGAAAGANPSGEHREDQAPEDSRYQGREEWIFGRQPPCLPAHVQLPGGIGLRGGPECRRLGARFSRRQGLRLRLVFDLVDQGLDRIGGWDPTHPAPHCL